MMRILAIALAVAVARAGAAAASAAETLETADGGRSGHRSIPHWVRAAIAAAIPESAKGAKAVVLLDETVLTVTAAGDITTRYRRVVRVQTNAGRDYTFASVYFDNDTKLKAFRGWAIDAKGTEYEVKEKDAVEMSPFDGELYSDSRSKILRIPGGEPGSTIAYEYEQRERPYLLQSVWQFQEDIPVLNARLQLVLPDGWTYDARWANAKPVESANAVWDLRDIPAIDDEPRMPSHASVAGRLGVIFIPPAMSADAINPQRSWNDLAKWYSGLASTRLAATPELQAKVREIARKGGAESIRALARFAQKDVRYVAIEVGIGGFQPHAAGDVFRNRYGDCKDKATLLKTMLKEIGVDSHYVLVHTTRGVVDPGVPTLGSFNHVILAIAAPDKHPATVDHPKLGKLLLFDPTSTTTAYGYLPSYLQDSRGLLVAPDGGELITMAAHAPEANQLRRKAALTLDAVGALSGNIEEVRTGWIASEMRSQLQTLNANDRVRFVESILSAHLTSYTASGIVIENLEDAETDLIIRYGIVANGYAKKVADMWLVRPRVVGQKPETIVDMAGRDYGYVTEGPSLHTDDVEIKVSSAMTVDELPKPVTVSTPAVNYSSRSEFKDGVLRYKRQYALQTYFVAREALPELNKTFAKILADERASAVFK